MLYYVRVINFLIIIIIKTCKQPGNHLLTYLLMWQVLLCVKGEDVSMGIWLSAVKPNYIDVRTVCRCTEVSKVILTLIWASCRINLWAFCHTPCICNFINSLISWVRSFTKSYLSDNDNIAPFENATPINQNIGQKKRTQSRLIRLIGVVFSRGTMLSVSDKSELVNERTHNNTDNKK